MSKKNEHAGSIILISIALVLPFAAWYGFVVSRLWSWFVEPLGVVPVGVWEAAGVYLLIRLLTMDTTLARDDETPPVERLVKAVTVGVLTPAMTLAFGALYHAFR